MYCKITFLKTHFCFIKSKIKSHPYKISMVIQLIQFAIHTANTGTSGGDCGRGKYRLPRTVCPHDVARCLNSEQYISLYRQQTD